MIYKNADVNGIRFRTIDPARFTDHWYECEKEW